MKRYVLLLTVMGVCATQLVAQSTPKGEIFTGYAFTHNSDQVGGLNFNGFNIALSANVTRKVGVVFELGGNFGETTYAQIKDKKSLYTFLGGPRYYFRSDSRVTPFVHIFVGASHQLATVTDPTGTYKSTATEFALATGGGFDVNVSPRVSIRIAQLDYRYTRGFLKNNFRYCGGLLFKF